MKTTTAPAFIRRGFSLIEILFAIFILGIGLLMIAAVFPVAIKWTNQDVHSTIGLVISRSAVAQIKANTMINGQSVFATGIYASGSNTPLSTQYGPVAATYPQPYFYGTPAPVPSRGLLVPTTANIAPAYSSHDLQARYWWQALLLPDPADGASGVAPTPLASQSGAAPQTYDLFIFVYSKGDIANKYPQVGPYPAPTLAPQFDAQAGSGTGMPIGSIGLDLKPVPNTGTPYTHAGSVVRREIINPPGQAPTIGYSGTTLQYNSIGPNDVIVYAPPASGPAQEATSPLIYIYATTVTF
jgi:prepilin-type N-terminal cleavage/methylation domain-containing protein